MRYIILLLSLIASAAMAKTTYTCQVGHNGGSMILSFDDSKVIDITDDAKSYGGMRLNENLSIPSQLVYKGGLSNLTFHNAFNFVVTLPPSFAAGAPSVTGTFRADGYDQGSPSAAFECTRN